MAKTLRLTFRFSDGDVRLVEHERLDMICPPSTRDRPHRGRNGGFWMELRDEKNDVRFHRLLHDPLRESVEVRSAEHPIKRVFGPPRESVFVVLVPDDPNATSITLIGPYLDPAKPKRDDSGASVDLLQFSLPDGKTLLNEAGQERPE